MFEQLWLLAGIITGFWLGGIIVWFLSYEEKVKRLREEMIRKFCARDKIIYYEFLHKLRN